MAAPIVLHGYKSEDESLILATRSGEPSFVWVQDFMDAWQAALSRGVELHVPRALYSQLVRGGEAPRQPPQVVRLI